ncbi:hypothetical protein EAI_15265, partial [Harpegnathos saltator]
GSIARASNQVVGMGACSFLHGGSPGDEPREVGHFTSRGSERKREVRPPASVVPERAALCQSSSVAAGCR